MKAFNTAIKAMAALLLAGALLVSCGLNTADDSGTLLIRLPGSSARATGDPISAPFMNTLSYLIDCAGPGKVSKVFPSGSPGAVSLSPGDWTVTVTVLNVAGRSLGTSDKIRVTIEAGKTTAAQLPAISIDTSRCEIIGFYTGIPGSRAVIDHGGDTAPAKVTIMVPFGSVNDNISTYFTIVHEGVSTDPGTSTPYSLHLDFTMNMKVTAENGVNSKTYEVSVKELDLPGWPSNAIWGSFGLSGIAPPPGVSLVMNALVDNTLTVVLGNATLDSLQEIQSFAETATGETGYLDTTSSSYGLYAYTLDYTYAGTDFRLSMELLEGIKQLYLTIEPDIYLPSVWPGPDKWAEYGLPGMEQHQPPITAVTEVTEVVYSFQRFLTVTLGFASPGDFDALETEITSTLGTTPSMEDAPDGDKSATWLMANGMVNLSWYLAGDEIVITAVKNIY